MTRTVFKVLILTGVFIMKTTEIFPSFLKNLEMIKLDNGLTVLFKPDNTLPLVSIQVWVGAGSIYESENTRGLSHFLEHLIFKGTKKYPGDAISHLVETTGGVINAGTSKEYTIYFIDTQKDAFITALDILADAMQNASFPVEELEKERLVVIEEIKRSDDTPEARLYELFFQSIFTTSPYRYRIIGDEKVIRDVSRDEIIAYYKKYYVPSNMVVSIVGDLTKDEVVRSLQQTFAIISPGEKPEQKIPKETITPKEKFRSEKKNVAHIYAVCGFLGPDTKSDEIYAAEVTASILAEGRSSRLYSNLREKKQLVYSIGGAFYAQRGDGLFVISAIFENKDTIKELVCKQIEQEIIKLADEGPTEDELNRVKEIINSHWIFNQEKIHNQAAMLGYWKLQDNLEILDKYLEKINSVTKTDVQNFLKKYNTGLVWSFIKPL